MKRMREHRLGRAIDDLLQMERNALLSGDFARLAQLSDRKSTLFKAIPTSSLEPPVLDRITEAVRRNQVLLAAAIAGIKDASARIDVLRAGHGFVSYGREGKRETLEVNCVTLQRKF